MRIGALDSGQPLGWRRNKNERNAAQESSRDMTSSEFDSSMSEAASSSVSNDDSANSEANNASPNGVSPNSMRPAVVRATGGVPGAGVSSARTVQWKGKTLNMSAARAPEEAPVESAAMSGGEASVQTLNANLATLLAGMDEMCGGLQEIYGVLHKVSERDTAGEKVFNTLHAELSDYKKDFIYEHLKPVVRPLLFLYDSLEQFEGEIERFDPVDVQPASVEKSGVMPTRMVRQNTIYFREQLVEALRICEVTPMDDPEGVFNPRFHKAVKVVPVEASEDGKVQRVVRSGWFLNGQLLRSAEVVIGKKK